ncbi:MAG: hypothetical protein GWN73_34680, partial [Actinobacteria bacterium]|nr:hypothetical protein [Actinomycetota bacterium]NIT98205.1 hypothetical protein [Actinomycetota bacterium]NIU70244.1 hypothetical protein [Actinomycetota bacterium]NIV58385.1 hypothetical protein [Actinomycetota bacterium]NIX53182.1 hypothetical protein [Actinomycetota bacterium]
MADGLLNLDGVTGAEVVGGRIEIDVATVEALARTGRMLVGLGSWVPADAIVLSEEMTEALSVLGEERIAGFTR